MPPSFDRFEKGSLYVVRAKSDCRILSSREGAASRNTDSDCRILSSREGAASRNTDSDCRILLTLEKNTRNGIFGSASGFSLAKHAIQTVDTKFLAPCLHQKLSAAN
jgi:hypothetical protein